MTKVLTLITADPRPRRSWTGTEQSGLLLRVRAPLQGRKRRNWEVAQRGSGIGQLGQRARRARRVPPHPLLEAHWPWPGLVPAWR